MARSEKQKQKLFRLLEILFRFTDDEHGLTMSEIISALGEYGITAERKSIYYDFDTLAELGFSVEKLPTRPTSYYLSNRIFELAELKLLVDAIQSSKFITVDYSKKLIGKLSLFAGGHGAGALSRAVHVEGRAKTLNKSTIYTIDAIHTAINENRKITFQYFDYNGKKEKVLKRSGEPYTVSPASLAWSDENYYLVGIDERGGIIKNFRVDKMQNLSLLDEARVPSANINFNSAEYSQKIFGMYGGEETAVTLECDESLAGVIIDRFGAEHTFIKTDKGFRVTLRVMVSPNFFAWVSGFGEKIEIIKPESVRERFVSGLKSTLSLYGENE